MRLSVRSGSLAALLVTMLLAVPTPSARAADDAHLRAIGSLGASHIYTTYGYIGVLADAYVKDVYTAEKVQELMGEVVGIINANLKNLETVKQAGLSDADKQSVDEMIGIYKLLQNQAQTLSEFTKSKDREKAQAFEKTRQEVWPKIAKLLGIEE